MQLMMTGLQAEHYKPLAINDTLSARVYKIYLKRLDYYKQYFTQEDIAKLKQYQYKIDDEINAGTFEFYDLVNSILDKRIGEDSVDVKQILSQPFDYNKKDQIETDPEKVNFAKDDKELHEIRYKSLKSQAMFRLADAMNAQDKAKETKDTAVKIKTYEQMEKDSRAKVLKTYENLFHGYVTTKENDKLSEFFDAIANAFDPHTEYFAPQERKDFDIRMSGQLEGIGAQLLDKNGNITVTKVIPGSPAWKNGELKEGDVILKVAQDTGEAVDIEGMRLDDAVAIIRGKKGSTVKLTIRKANNTTKTIALVRDVIEIAETYAHDAIIDQGEKIGYIRLPEFYTNFDGEGTRTSWNDIKQQLIELRNEGVQGIVMDLRDNGGGSLQDVVKMVGLLIPNGPVVQVKSRTQPPQMLDDNDTSVVYRGPFVVLVNGYSASASEIFAAAIQDYKRGVIMGSTTYGKGTVQQIFNLDDYVSASFKDLKPLGSVKITISKFYRINGGSTQLDGVTPDIQVPDSYEYLYQKEKASEYPVNFDRIPPADYRTWGASVDKPKMPSFAPSTWNSPPDFPKLKADAENNMAGDSAIQLIKAQALQYKKQKDNSLYPLNLEDYRKQQKEQTDNNKKFEGISKVNPLMKVYPTSKESAKMANDTNEAKTENQWLKQLTKDPELFEATKVIGDMK